MAKFAIFPLLIDRWLVGTRLMTREQRSAYLELLLYLFQEGGTIKDESHVARILDCDPRTARRLWRELRGKFRCNVHGHFHELVSKIRNNGGKIKGLGYGSDPPTGTGTGSDTPDPSQLPPLSQESRSGSSVQDRQVAQPKKLRDRTRATGTRIPPGWEPSDMAKSWAANNVDLALDLKRELERFRDYWSARPGAGGRKVDWEATWRNWLRKADEDLAKRQPQGGNGDGRRETRYDRDMRAIYEANMTGADDDELERERPHRLLGDDA